MYEKLFQTQDRPFRATPDVRFYHQFDSMEQTRQTILRVVRRAEGPAAVMGSAGLGKSLLAQLLAEDLKDRFDVVRLHAARLCSRRAMLQNILFELRLPYRELSEGELRLSLMERLEPSPDVAADGLVLIIDEAQTLPTKLLEELRLITNFARHGQARARLVLLGTLQLEETLALPEMNSFNQRLAARCFLQPMNRQQTADFVRHQFACGNVDGKQVITSDALENVYIASEGIPRLANQVMDHALILAIANDQYPISASLIQEAWADLQQLPLAWGSGEPTNAMPVEFGSIDDLDQDFELEPEGVEELDLGRSMDWPTPTDLEDFGPYGSVVAPQSPMPVHENKPAAEPRVVFDAKAAFASRMTSATTSEVSHSGFEIDHGDQDLFIFQEDQPTYQASDTASSNMFSGWSQSTIPLDLASPTGGVSIEFELNLADISGDNTLPMPLAASMVNTGENPFGEDFDEEFIVDDRDIRRWQQRERTRRQMDSSYISGDESATAIESASECASKYVNECVNQGVNECVNQGVNECVIDGDIDCVNDGVKDCASKWALEAATERADDCSTGQACFQADTGLEGLDYPHQSSEISSVSLAGDGPAMTDSFASDLVGMIGSGTLPSHQEIEDLISQLNFSAFSVEMDSVEQISPDFIREAASAKAFLSGQPHLMNAAQNDVATYPIRREEQGARADHSPRAELSDLDDDRDLLIIEEDIPASVRHQNPPTGAPTVSTVSYPQLFQQLRS